MVNGFKLTESCLFGLQARPGPEVVSLEVGLFNAGGSASLVCGFGVLGCFFLEFFFFCLFFFFFFFFPLLPQTHRTVL